MWSPAPLTNRSWIKSSMDCQEIDKEYQVLGLAGSGSTGLVYRAKHRLSGEDVAIKEYPGGETPFSRILQELSFLFSTRHPNLVTCLNLIYGGYRRSYLVMEYARNGSLRDFLNREKQVSSQEALAAVEQVLEGLAHLHAEGVIHCDLKPENVLLFPREEDSELVKLSDQILKITDFDVSVRAGKGDTTKSQGSPMYMAPEQFYDKVTPSSDLYSVGAILFELVTGHFLFEGDTSHLFSQHLNVEPDFDLIQDEKIREFCQALLKKDPYQRPEDAEAALVLLRCLVKDKPIAPSCKRWEWFELDYVRNPTKKTLLRLPVPGATRCFPLASGDFLLAHRNGTDLLSGSQSRLSPNRLLEPALSVSSPQPDGSVYVACPSWVGHLSSEGRWTPLFRPLSRIRALDYCPRSRTLLLADCKNVKLTTTFGDLVVSLPLGNYFLDPAVALWEEGFLATSGPSQPSLLLCHTGSAETSHRRIPLPAPALCCTMTAQGPIVATFATSQGEEPALIRLKKNDEWEVMKTLEPGLLGARFQGDLLIQRYEDRIVTSSLEGEHEVCHSTRGTPLDAAWNYQSRQLIAILQSQRFTEVVVTSEGSVDNTERRAS